MDERPRPERVEVVIEPVPGQPVDEWTSTTTPGAPPRRGPVALGVVVGLAVVAAAVVLLVRRVGDDTSHALVNANGRVLVNLHAAPSSKPSKRWTTKVACTLHCELATDGLRVYALLGESVRTGEGPHTIAAYAVTDGHKVWKHTMDDRIVLPRPAAVFGRTLLVPTRPTRAGGDRDDAVVALDASTGSRRWMAAGFQDGRTTSGDALLSRLESSGSRSVVDVDPRQGKVRWSAHGNLIGACAGHILIDDAGVRVVSAETGKDEWSLDPDAEPQSVQCTPDGVFTSFKGQVAMFELASGIERWATTVDKATQVSAAPGIVLVQAGKDIVGLDPRTGRRRWTTHDPALFVIPAPASLVVYRGKVLVLERAGERKLDIATGELGQRRRYLPGALFISYARTSMVRFGPHAMVDVDLDTLATRWEVRGLGDVRDLVVADHRVIFSDDGKLVGYG
jgi:outer membrane protein assembly factor BamB